jgi:hypothetical protein
VALGHRQAGDARRPHAGADGLDEDRVDTGGLHAPRPGLVVVLDAPDLERGRAVVEVEQRVVHRGVAVVVGLADGAAVHREASAAQTAHERQPRVRAHEAADVVGVEPGLEAQVVELDLVQELAGVPRAAVTKQHLAAGELDDALRRPGRQLVARRVAERGRRQLERLTRHRLVVGGRVAAAAGLGARHRLLLVVAGDEDVEARADERHHLLAVAAAADAVAEEGGEVGAAGRGVVEAGLERRQVAVRAPHRCQPAVHAAIVDQTRASA